MKRAVIIAAILLIGLAVPVLAAMVKTITHETGDLSEYWTTVGLVDVGPGLIGTQYALSATTLSELPSNAIFLNLNMDDRTRTRLYFDPNGYQASADEPNRFIQVCENLGCPTGTWWIDFYCEGSDCFVRLVDIPNSGVPIVGEYIQISDDPHCFEIDYYVSPYFTSDGFLKLWIDKAGGSPDEEFVNLENYDQPVNVWAFGMVYAGTVAQGGPVFIDEIIINNDGSLIGPEVPISYPFRLWLPIVYRAETPSSSLDESQPGKHSSAGPLWPSWSW